MRILFTPGKFKLGYNLEAKSIDQVYRNYILGACLSAILTLLLLYALYEFLVWGNGQVHGFGFISAAMIPLAGVFYFLLATVSLFEYAYETKKDLADESCVELLEWCAEYPGVESYRQHVISEGRKFKLAEYISMRQYVNNQKWLARAHDFAVKNKAACKQLYTS